jgi:hypothetical protein
MSMGSSAVHPVNVRVVKAVKARAASASAAEGDAAGDVLPAPTAAAAVLRTVLKKVRNRIMAHVEDDRLAPVFSITARRYNQSITNFRRSDEGKTVELEDVGT